MRTTSNKLLVTPVKEAGNKKNELGLTLPGNLEMQGLEKVEVLFAGDEIREKGISAGEILVIYKNAGTKFMDETGRETRVISITDIVVIYE